MGKKKRGGKKTNVISYSTHFLPQYFPCLKIVKKKKTLDINLGLRNIQNKKSKSLGNSEPLSKIIKLGVITIGDHCLIPSFPCSLDCGSLLLNR